MENKTKPVRRKEPGNRLLRIAVKITPEEHQTLQERSARAGLYMAAYLRKMVFKGKLIARLTDEEKELFRGMVNLANSLNNVLVLARQQGVTDLLPSLEKQCAQIDELLEKWRS